MNMDRIAKLHSCNDEELSVVGVLAESVCDVEAAK